MDIPLVGGSFTWSNYRDPPSWSRVDRFFVSPNSQAQSLDVTHKRLPTLCLDHFPMLVDCEGLMEV